MSNQSNLSHFFIVVADPSSSDSSKALMRDSTSGKEVQLTRDDLEYLVKNWAWLLDKSDEDLKLEKLNVNESVAAVLDGMMQNRKLRNTNDAESNSAYIVYQSEQFFKALKPMLGIK